MTNAILGGGISGLSAAYYLSKATKNGIRMYESSQRLGGWIKSSKNESGTIFEVGPRTLRCGGIAGENTLELVKELGLTSLIHAVPRTSSAAKNRMVYVDNQLFSLPNSWTCLFRIDPPFIPPFIKAIVKDLKTPKQPLVDDSIYNFVARRFGKEYADVLLSAMICGIFAGDAKEISVKALMGNLFQNEQEFGSVIGGMFHSFKKKFSTSERTKENRIKSSKETKDWSVWSFKNGLETLPNEMTKYLKNAKGVEINLGKKCSKIVFKSGKALLTINDNVETADYLFSSLSCKDLAKILQDDFLKKELSAIPFVNVAVVNLEYEGDLLDNKGFGFLVPPSQNLPILGVIFDSCILPQEGRTVLTVMMGGRWFEHHFGPDPDESLFLRIAKDHVRSILKIDKEPSLSMVNILRDCIPQYVIGHSDRVQRIRKYIEDHELPLTLIGNSFDGVGVNDAILSARKGVEEALTRFSTMTG